MTLSVCYVMDDDIKESEINEAFSEKIAITNSVNFARNAIKMSFH